MKRTYPCKATFEGQPCENPDEPHLMHETAGGTWFDDDMADTDRGEEDLDTAAGDERAPVLTIEGDSAVVGRAGAALLVDHERGLVPVVQRGGPRHGLLGADYEVVP